VQTSAEHPAQQPSRQRPDRTDSPAPVIVDPLRQYVASDRGKQIPKVDAQLTQHLAERSSKEYVAVDSKVCEQLFHITGAELLKECRGPQKLEAHIRQHGLPTHLVGRPLEVTIGGDAQSW